MGELETWFAPFRDNIIGNERAFDGPFGERRIVYLDWTASGRLYGPIERALLESAGPFVANTHSESNLTGTTMTHAYHEAQRIIKEHVHAGPRDVIICAGAGMTAVINKFQRILGLRVAEQIQPYAAIPDDIRPVVFVTHMEHHSNQTSWLETIAMWRWSSRTLRAGYAWKACARCLRSMLSDQSRSGPSPGAAT
jgi:selenocysteine lyase/cysteine desulfurase